jgi:predicted transcriptional regulator
MKSHISATIDSKLVEALQHIGKRERRSLSNVLESAVSAFVEGKLPRDEIVTSEASFKGRFSRRETHARPSR